MQDLQGRASFGRYLQGFANGEQLTGAEREMAEHRGITTAGNWLPWDALLGPAPSVELRADAVTPAPASGNPTNQAEILQRVFARGAVARLGVSMPSVGVGQASYPIIGIGQSAEFKAKDAEKDAAAGEIEPNALGPVRLQARVQFRVEDAMVTMGLESALREDLSRAISDQLDAQVVGAGDPRVRGFLATNGKRRARRLCGPQPTWLRSPPRQSRPRAASTASMPARRPNVHGWSAVGDLSAKLAALDPERTIQHVGNRAAAAPAERLHGVARTFRPRRATMQSGILAKLGAATFRP